MPTKRTKCAYCGKRLKPTTGSSPFNPVTLGAFGNRYDVCRACGREQPPGTEWSDMWREIRSLKGRSGAERKSSRRKLRQGGPAPSIQQPREGRIVWYVITPDGEEGPYVLQKAARDRALSKGWSLTYREIDDDG